MRVSVLLFLASIGFASQVNGQSVACDAGHFFATNIGCSASGRGQKCIELDITHSIDKEGKEFVYAWNFGDGTIKRGALSEYCYEKYGTYRVTLDLLDPKTEIVIKNELSTTVNLLPKIEYQTDTLTSSFATFAYDRKMMFGVKVEKVFWKIEEQFYCGETAKHTFTSPGLYVVEIGVIGKDANNENFQGCTLMAVYIKKKP